MNAHLPLLLMLLCTGSAATAQDELRIGGPRVSTQMIEGRQRYTVRTEDSSALQLLTKIAQVSGRELMGLEFLDRPAIVTVDLTQRRLDQVLEYFLGSLGLRYRLGPTTIELLAGSVEDSEELLDLASAAWLSASSKFPGHALAAHARFSQGEIAEKRNRFSAARSFYLSLVDDYPLAEETGRAYMRAGRISAELGQWVEASKLFKTLARLDVASELHAAARLEWARATIAQGDPRQALYILAALETNYPTSDKTEITARRLVKARGYNELGQYMDALREIDNSDENFDDIAAWEALLIRAVALAEIGMPGEAARAWLLYATEAKGKVRARAFSEAARLSLEAQDEMGVLFVAKQAELVGLGAGLEDYVRTARVRLGFELEAGESSLADRIAQAESWVDTGRFAEATEVLQSLFLARGGFAESNLRARVSVGWAQCVENASGIDEAIAILATERPTHQTPDDIRLLDIAAAQLFEKYDRFDEAIGAYQGGYVRP